MPVVAPLVGEVELAAKSRTGLESQAVSTGSSVDGSLQILALADLDHVPACGSIRQGALHMHPGQLRRSIKLRGRRGCLSLGIKRQPARRQESQKKRSPKP